jgi:hypothetical protein
MFEGYSIVFVEDDLPVRVSLIQTLELAGLSVIPCRSAEEALPHISAGAQIIVDTQRFWHAVWHQGTEPRYCLITSWESGPELDAYIANHVPLENEDGIRIREKVLVHIGTMHREWVKIVATKRGLNVEAVKSAGGELFTSGSYRLGVHEPGADIGTCRTYILLCVLVNTSSQRL